MKVEPVGEFELKGIRRPMAAFNVLGLSRKLRGLAGNRLRPHMTLARCVLLAQVETTKLFLLDKARQVGVEAQGQMMRQQPCLLGSHSPT